IFQRPRRTHHTMSENDDRHAFEREVTTDLNDQTPDPPKGRSLHTRILLGMVIGAAVGITASAVHGADHPRLLWIVHNVTEPIGNLFLRLLLMVVIPLVFSAIVVGVAGVGDIRQLG